MAKQDKKPAAPKKVYFQAKDADGKPADKYELLGKRFLYKGDVYNADEAAKNNELMNRLIEDQSPSIAKV